MKTKIQSQEHAREIYLDIIKIIAIFMVLYNHRSTYTIAASCVGGGKPIVIQILATLCRCGVPLFFMASGVLLLRKNETFGYILKHRVIRILIVMLICTLIKAWGGGVSFLTFIDIFFTKLNWYLYAYLDYLLMLPFIRLIAQNATKEQKEVWIVLVTIFYTIGGCLIFANYYTGFIDFAPIYNTQFASLCWGIIFSLTGYFFINNEFNKSRKWILFLVVGAIISIVLSVVFVMIDIKYNSAANIEQLRIHFIFLPSCLIFYLCKVLYDWNTIFKNKVVEQCIITISSTVFGIFILETHSELINYVNWKLSLNPISNYLGDYVMGMVSIITQFVICFIIICILKHIPYLKKIL